MRWESFCADLERKNRTPGHRHLFVAAAAIAALYQSI